MKKNLLFAASILTIGGFLAACGTDETTGTGADPAEESATAPEEAVEEVTEEETVEEAPEEEAETVTEEKEEDTAEQPEDDAAEEESEEAAEEEEAAAPETDSANRAETEGTLTASDEQAYGMYVLPGYELTSEEPGKDSLYLSEDSSTFMRVETFDPATLDFAGAKASLIESLEATSNGAELTEGTLEGDFTNSVMYTAPSDFGEVTGIVFEKDNFVVRLTIYDSADATADFIEMGKTVQANS